MPYTIPTAQDLKDRHPAFSDTPDSQVEAVITDASRWVDETWLEDDYRPALMFLAAHMLVGEGALGGDTSAPGPVTSYKLGDASETYGNAVDPSRSISDFGTTVYGRRYMALLRVNQPAVAIV